MALVFLVLGFLVMVCGILLCIASLTVGGLPLAGSVVMAAGGATVWLIAMRHQENPNFLDT